MRTRGFDNGVCTKLRRPFRYEMRCENLQNAVAGATSYLILLTSARAAEVEITCVQAIRLTLAKTLANHAVVKISPLGGLKSSSKSVSLGQHRILSLEDIKYAVVTDSYAKSLDIYFIDGHRNTTYYIYYIFAMTAVTQYGHSLSSGRMWFVVCSAFTFRCGFTLLSHDW